VTLWRSRMIRPIAPNKGGSFTMEESMIDVLSFQAINGASIADVNPSFSYVLEGGQPVYTSPPSKKFYFCREV